MNVLTKEIKACMSSLTTGADGECSALFVFPPEFSGFKGHFPGNTVLPGVCMVQAVLVMLAARKQTPVTLSAIVSAKWFAPVKPGAELRVECREKAEAVPHGTVKARIICGAEKVAELTLRVSNANGAKDGSP